MAATITITVVGEPSEVKAALAALNSANVTNSVVCVAGPMHNDEPTIEPTVEPVASYDANDGDKPRRTRRTKAQIEADRAAEAAAAAVTLPVAPASEAMADAAAHVTAVSEPEAPAGGMYEEFLQIAKKGIAARLVAVRGIEPGTLVQLRNELAGGASLVQATDEQFADILMAASNA